MTALTALTGLTTLTTIAAHGPGPWGDGGGPHGFLFLVPLFWLLVIGTIITVAVLGRRRREAGAGRRSGERVLAERFADGSIDEAEYRARRAVLRAKD